MADLVAILASPAGWVGIVAGIAIGMVLMKVAAPARPSVEAEQLREELERLRRSATAPVLVTRHAADGLVLQDMDGRILWCNPAFTALTGWREAEVIGRRPQEFLLPPDERPDSGSLASFRYTPDSPLFGTQECVENVTRDGQSFWNQLSFAHAPGRDSEESRVVVVCRDASDQVEALDAAIADRSRAWAFEGMAEAVSDGLALLDMRGRLEWANPAFTKLVGAGLSELRGRNPLSRILKPEDMPAGEDLFRFDADKLPGAGILCALPPGQGDAWAELRYKLMPPPAEVDDEAAGGPRILAMLRDVTPLVQNEREVRAAHTALGRWEETDPVTDLPNRQSITRCLTESLEQAAQAHRRTGLIHVDLLRLREVNETLSHAAGDAVLAALARRMTDVLGTGDRLGRGSGGEFLTVCTDIAGLEALEARARTLLEAIEAPVEWQGCSLSVRGRAGVSLSEPGQYQAARLFQQAAIALEEQGGASVDPVQAFTEAMGAAWTSRLALRSDLARAIGSDQFLVHLQPQVTLADGALAGFEALLRWQHPQRGLLGPGEFLPLARQAGLAAELDRVALGASLDGFAALRSRGLAPGRLGVNLALESLVKPRFADTLSWELESRGLSPEDIALELQESILIGVAGTDLERALRHLARSGVAVLIDEFGSGQAALAPFAQLPLAGVKLHPALLRRLARSPEKRRIVRGIIAICADLGRVAIATGVESMGEARRLQGLGCQLAQGYAFAPPMSVDEIADRFAVAPPVASQSLAG